MKIEKAPWGAGLFCCGAGGELGTLGRHWEAGEVLTEGDLYGLFLGWHVNGLAYLPNSNARSQVNTIFIPLRIF
jgi:hypothetical protein